MDKLVDPDSLIDTPLDATLGDVDPGVSQAVGRARAHQDESSAGASDGSDVDVPSLPAAAAPDLNAAFDDSAGPLPHPGLAGEPLPLDAVADPLEELGLGALDDGLDGGAASDGSGGASGAAPMGEAEAPAGTSGPSALGSVSYGLPGEQEGWNIAAMGLEGLGGEFTGEGVKIGFVDDGFDYLTNRDLTPNYRTDLDYDARDKDDDAAATHPGDYHGTMVMGVGTAARDGGGVVGVAYDADAVGYRIGYGSYGNISQVADAFAQAVDKVDVINNSWGWGSAFADNPNSVWFKEAFANLDRLTTEGRDGLGTSVVFSAGNGGNVDDDTNLHGFQAHRDVIVVGAYDQNGDRASFSTQGANLLVSAPGANVLLDYNAGLAYGNGTSFAAPAVSGVIGLMLEANKDLGYRDIREILAYSASTIALSAGAQASFEWNGASNWNGGGLHFSNGLGFGAIDAHDAVRLAESWNQTQTAHNKESVTLGGSQATVADGGAVTVTAASGVDIEVETARLSLNLTGPLKSATIKLISPSGTESVLLDTAPVTNTSMIWALNSNEFLGESSKGDWQLVVIDNARDGQKLVVKSWSLSLSGSAQGNDTYVYTDDFSGLGADHGVTIDDETGLDVVNGAALTGDATINLVEGATSVIAGKDTILAAHGTVLEDAIGGDGNDTIIGNGAANMLSGARGDDVLHGGAGNDILKGGAGNDILEGGAGADQMSGGSGADIFRWSGAEGDGGDRIADFTVGEDKLDLRGYLGSRAGNTDWLGLGFLKLVDGPDGVQVLVNREGSASAGSSFELVVTLAGVTASQLHLGQDLLLTDLPDAVTEPELQPEPEPELEPEPEPQPEPDPEPIPDPESAPDPEPEPAPEPEPQPAPVDEDQGGTAPSTVETIVMGDGVVAATAPGSEDVNVTGNDLNNKIWGNAADNVIDGGAGADAMSGGLGDDVYIVDDRGDKIHEVAGGGVDEVRSSVTFYMFENGHVENLVLTGVDDIHGYGNALANVITGNAGNNILDGQGGADLLIGGLGDDVYGLDSYEDRIIEEAGGGVDTAKGWINIDLSSGVLAGQEIENIELLGYVNRNATGNAMDNVIKGNAGRNVIEGGAGADTLIGGADFDVFVYTGIENEGGDRILDFQNRYDSIDLRQIFEGLSASTAWGSEGYLKVDDDGEGNARIFVDKDGFAGDQFDMELLVTVDNAAGKLSIGHDIWMV